MTQENHVLLFDTETNGLPKNWKASIMELDNWPRVIQLAWTLADQSGQILNRKEFLIKPNGWEIPVEEFWTRHGFATEISARDGTAMEGVLDEFLADQARAEFLVAHNIAFDHKVLGAELLRYGRRGRKATRLCTMESSVDLCKIPFSGQRSWLSKKDKTYKWPKLEELHMHLFGKDFDNKHQAGGDLGALEACFFELVARGVLQLQPQNPAE
jgi:DNA polymerase III subunit epsilon